MWTRSSEFQFFLVSHPNLCNIFSIIQLLLVKLKKLLWTPESSILHQWRLPLSHSQLGFGSNVFEHRHRLRNPNPKIGKTPPTKRASTSPLCCLPRARVPAVMDNSSIQHCSQYWKFPTAPLSTWFPPSFHFIKQTLKSPLTIPAAAKFEEILL